jgi:hypothetical protein
MSIVLLLYRINQFQEALLLPRSILARCKWVEGYKSAHLRSEKFKRKFRLPGGL